MLDRLQQIPVYGVSSILEDGSAAANAFKAQNVSFLLCCSVLWVCFLFFEQALRKHVRCGDETRSCCTFLFFFSTPGVVCANVRVLRTWATLFFPARRAFETQHGRQIIVCFFGVHRSVAVRGRQAPASYRCLVF